MRLSKSRNLPYYFHTASGESSWEPPRGSDAEKLSAYISKKFSHIPPLTYNSLSGEEGKEDKIRASHLLVKHKDVRRPSSWKEANITRTKDEAMAIILAHEARIRSGAATLSELATAESDCNSARRGGDLGYFGRGDMQKEFEDAAFDLKPGQMSRVVETQSGLHLIERTG